MNIFLMTDNSGDNDEKYVTANQINEIFGDLVSSHFINMQNLSSIEISSKTQNNKVILKRKNLYAKNSNS